MDCVDRENVVRYLEKFAGFHCGSIVSDFKNKNIMPSVYDGESDLISRNWLIDIAIHLMNTAKNDDIAVGVKWLWQYIIDAPAIINGREKE